MQKFAILVALVGVANGIRVRAVSSAVENVDLEPANLGAVNVNVNRGAILHEYEVQINCPPLTLVDGTLFYVPPPVEGGYAAGTIAQGMCNVGFHLEGTASTICKDGIWQPVLGVCKSNTQESTTLVIPTLPTLPTQPTQCPPIIVAGGTATYDRSDRNGTDEWLKAEGSKVSITCERGFELDGASQSTCVKGVWEPPIGFCKLKICTNSSPVLNDCPSMPSPAGASLTYSNNSALAMTFPTGTLVVMNCTSGSAQGPAAASCSNGTWIPPTLGTCSSMVMNVTGGWYENVQCSATATRKLTRLDGRSVDLQKDHETKVYLTCLPNTMPEGPISSYCHNGTWTPELGACYVHCL